MTVCVVELSDDGSLLVSMPADAPRCLLRAVAASVLNYAVMEGCDADGVLVTQRSMVPCTTEYGPAPVVLQGGVG